MPDKRTIDVYDERASDYIKLTSTSSPDESLKAFMAEVSQGGKILDLGCGPGNSSAHMRAAGFDPVAIDASQGMVDLANETFNIGARLGTFDDVTEDSIYDGVWANFSLLHAPEKDLPRYICAIAKALKPGGVFHIGMKTGTGEKRDAIERLYTFVTVDELHKLISDAGLTVTFTKEGRDKGLSGSIDPYAICRAIKDA